MARQPDDVRGDRDPPVVEIREVTIDDLAPVFHLGERVFTSRDFSNLYRTWDEYEVTALFHTEPEYFLVAEVDDRLAGFAMGTMIEKHGTAWNYGHLVWLGVDSAFRGRGIADRLFDRFRDIMEEAGVRMLLVDTQADNAPAIRFFARKGFTNPVDHVYMTLNLDTAD